MTSNHNYIIAMTKGDRLTDLIVRIFKFKSQALLRNITKSYVLGRIVAHVYAIEFQKRGLPHMHFFHIFATKNKIIDVVLTNQIICAKFLNLEVDPILLNRLLKTMVHGPCGHTFFILHA
jgi:hypothetical protein